MKQLFGVDTSYYSIDDNGCWNWLRSKSKKGYGRIWFNKKLRAAHRVTYEIKYGDIPKGLQIDHLCRNRACINPDHMEAVTPLENVRRGNRAKLSLEKAAEMRKSSLSKRELMVKYGISKPTVDRVIHNHTWI